MAVRDVLSHWLRSDRPARPSAGGRPPALPDGLRAYAVGDLHGRFDLLLEMEELIAADLAARPPGGAVHLVHLGDYVDRGPATAPLLEHLVRQPVPGVKTTFLRGNHDEWFRQVLAGDGPLADWLRHGGDIAAASYGLHNRPPSTPDGRLNWQRTLRRRVPVAHQRFLEETEYSLHLGDYFFCHAGIRPGLPLHMQGAQDLMWIRAEFLDHPGDLGVVVVHGHTIVDQPVIRTNRIGIDTGAVRSGRLTAVVLEGQEIRFLSTGGN